MCSLTTLGHLPEPGLGSVVDLLAADIEAVRRRYKLTYAPSRMDRMERLLVEWRAELAKFDVGDAHVAERVDYVLILNHLDRIEVELRRARAEAYRLSAAVPFGAAIIGLDDQRESMARPDPAATAATLDHLAKSIADAPTIVGDVPAREWAGELSAAMERWSAFHDGYDPQLEWWIREPLTRVQTNLRAYLDRANAPEAEGTPIPGRAVGRVALEDDLALAMVPYSPEELIEIGEREYAWCLHEMKRAAAELGFGEDWRAAVEHVKETYVAPGEQTEAVRDLAREAIDWVESRDLLTIPDMAKETWQMEMMFPERQKVSPFFLGGETIIVSYPTHAMTYAEKRMSMRGNNPNFSRATVQHELIPGHHLQLFMLDRHRKYRQLFGTPFWIEGWTLYWELLLWDLGFPQTPEQKIGMLFWRMHRCVRIAFSLRFHLGQMTTAECVETLVQRVGHERANAEGEVRRSFNGTYPPLYQAAYMIGGLMFRAMERELVGGGRMTHREFHDAILRENEMPPALLRMVLRGEAPRPGERVDWRFDDVAAR